jgi:SpoVK/Ycf46/Vps4 family AAA+-type ATPase
MLCKKPSLRGSVRQMPRNKTARKIEASEGDTGPARATLQALVAEARAQQQHGLANRFEQSSTSARPRQVNTRMRPQSIPSDVEGSLAQLSPRRRLRDLVLPANTSADIREFIDEYSEIQLLRSHGLEPRHKVLLVGPPGTGKTSLAEVLANELKLPFLVVRYDGLIASYLGETATRLRKLTDFVSEKPCLVFFDEFDTIGKERGDAQETGEIKRVVSSLLLQMDTIPSHCVVVCATNHPELLDRAVWRRFELRLDIPLPGEPEIREWFQRLVKDLGGTTKVDGKSFVKSLLGMNFSDIESFTLRIRRKIILSKGEVSPDEAIAAELAKLEERRSLTRDLKDSKPSNSPNSPRSKRTTQNKRQAKDDPAAGTLL